MAVLADCGATPIVMKNPRIDQLIVGDDGTRARAVWAQIYADRCAKQLERDLRDSAESLVSNATPDPLHGERSRIMRERVKVRSKKTKVSKAPG